MQRNLFDTVPVIPDRPAPHNNTETSKAAAERILPRAGTLRRLVYEAIVECGAVGATNTEIHGMTGIKLQTVCARANELWHGRLTRKSGLRRGGCEAWVRA